MENRKWIVENAVMKENFAATKVDHDQKRMDVAAQMVLDLINKENKD
ncbi:MAG: hypothetical protein ACR2J3_02580 [Aridibacter sp.]